MLKRLYGLSIILALASSCASAGQEKPAPAKVEEKPVEGPTAFNFIVYGDSRGGIAPKGCEGNAVHLNMVKMIANKNAAFVVHTGDMISGFSNATNFIQDGGCTEPASYGSFQRIVAPIQKKTPSPGLPMYLFPVVGNHDAGWKDKWYPDPYGNGICSVFDLSKVVPNHTKESYFKPTRGYERLSDKEFYERLCSTTDRSLYPAYVYYSFNYGNSHFVVLHLENDNHRLEGCNSCGPAKNDYDNFYNIHQLDWLRYDLDKTDADPKIKNIFVFLHASLAGSGYGHPKNSSYMLLSHEFTKHHVTMVFNGHNHLYERTKPVSWDEAAQEYKEDEKDGVVYITTAGGGATLTGWNKLVPYSAFIKKTFHYTLVQVRGEKITITAIDDQGNVIDTYTR